MFFEIKGSLLKRLTLLAEKKGQERAVLARQIFLKNLEDFEEEFAPMPDERTPSAQGGVETDSDIPKTENGVLEFADHHKPSNLSPEQKDIVRRNVSRLKMSEIATELGVSTAEVFRAKNEIAQELVAKNWKTMTDAEMAEQLGYSQTNEIVKIRSKLGLDRRVKIPRMDPNEIKKALTEDGETLTSFLQKKGVPTSRERLSQIAEKYDIYIKRDRKPIWWATYYGKPELGDRNTVIRLLEEKLTVSAASAAIGITKQKFIRICRIHGIDVSEMREKRAAEMVKLTCSECGGFFYRPKKRVEEQRALHPDQKLYFCTRICQGRHMGKHRTARKITMITVDCYICGTTFKKRKSDASHGQRHFVCPKLECRKEHARVMARNRAEARRAVARNNAPLT